MTIQTNLPDEAKQHVTHTISVIVPAYNASHYLERSLPPLIEMRERGEVLEVIVVDDCSTEASNIETATRLGATVMKMPRNGGPGAARNLAATKARGDLLWLVDADVIAHTSGPEQIRSAFTDDRVAAVFGSYDQHPPGSSFASGYKNLVHRYYHQHGNREASTFWSGCGVIRKSVYLDMGGFDCELFARPSIEDIEFGYRMKDKGWSILLVPTLLGTHLKEWSLGEVVKTDIFQRAIPWSQLLIEGRGPANDLNVSQSERLKAALAGLWLLSILALAVPVFWPVTVYAFIFLSVLVGVANAELFSFFARNKNIVFAVFATMFHQIYYLYSAVTYALCVIANITRQKLLPAKRTEVVGQK